MRIALIFDRDREDTLGIYFEKTFEGLPHSVTHFWTKDARDIPLEFDLYLRIDHGDYKYDIPEYLHPCCFYVVDTHLKKPYKKIRRQLWHYDYIFCAQKEGADRIRRDTGIEAIWVPLGCDLQICHKIDMDKRFDIGFVGTDGKKSLRKVLLNELKARYPQSFIGTAPHTQMSQIYSQSKIGFNYSINNDINMRIFEVMSCGTMLLTNKIKDNGFDELFIHGRHLVAYRNKKELLGFLDYYFTRDKEREAIAQQGRELVNRHHSYRKRVETMLKIIND